MEDFLTPEREQQLCQKIADAVVKAINNSTTIKKQDSYYMSRAETSKYLNVSYCTLWKWAKTHILEPHKMGRKVMYLRSDVMRIINGEN